MNNKKIALFMHPLLTHGGGAEKYFIEMAERISKRGYQIDVITMDRNFSKFFIKFLAIFYFKPEMFFWNYERENEEELKKQLDGARWLQVSLKNLKNILNQYNIIYSKNEIVDLFLLKIIGYRFLPPVIVGVHTPVFYPISKSFHSKLHNFLYSGSLYRWLLRGVKTIHAANSDDKKLMEKMTTGTGIAIKLIFHPFDVNHDNMVKIPSPDLNILFVGRFCEQKGVDVLADIVDEIASREKDIFKNLKFKIAGSGNKYLVKKINSLSERFDNINYLGHVPHSEINPIYQWADLVIIPSRYETVNYVGLEAGANEKIVLASDIPGPREVIKNEETGFLINLDVQSFSDKIIELYKFKKNDPEKFNQIGKNARKFIGEKFNSEKIFREMTKMFENNL